jgi:hypothetical protein
MALIAQQNKKRNSLINWHKILGHIDHRKILTLAKENENTELKLVPINGQDVALVNLQN